MSLLKPRNLVPQKLILGWPRLMPDRDDGSRIALAAADDDDRWGRVLAVGMTALLLSDSISRAVNA